jgi:hypothetical protein
MRHSFFRGSSLSLLLAASLGYASCSAGTNTGNGTNTGTGGGAGFCPYMPCSYPVNVTGSDGTTYRGRISPDITIASDSYAQSFPNPPVAELSFSGSEVDLTDAGCQDTGSYLQVQIFISTADSSIDASGTLHVHSAPRNDIFAAGPGYIYDPPIPGWAVELTVTTDGQLSATLSMASADSLDAGATVQETKLGGSIEPICGVPAGPNGGLMLAPDGGVIPASMPVSGGGTFNFPCWKPEGCGDWGDLMQ